MVIGVIFLQLHPSYHPATMGDEHEWRLLNLSRPFQWRTLVVSRGKTEGRKGVHKKGRIMVKLTNQVQMITIKGK